MTSPDNFFHTLGINPMLGRTFTPAEHQKGGRARRTSHLSLLAEPIRRPIPSSFGRTINFDNQAVTIIGVLPATFDFASVFSPGLQH